MSKIHIIADGGGTTTNWCIVEEQKRTYFVLESYHPTNWNLAFEKRITAFWRSRIDPADVKLTFFGAGCYREENRKRTLELFKRVGFLDVTVFSDLHAAAFAALGSKQGWVAIAGTGSVLFNWNGEDVTEVIGGKGRVHGDEGSGHYFGKLIINAYRNNELTEQQKTLFQDLISEDELSELILSESYSKLAVTLGGDFKLFQEYHEINIRRFFKVHFKTNTISKLFIVGGYAWHLQALFCEISHDFSSPVIHFLNEPIEPLVEQMVLFSD